MNNTISLAAGLITYAHIWCPAMALLVSLFRSRLFGRFSFAKFAEQLFLQLLFWVVGIENFIIFISMVWFPETSSNAILNAYSVYIFELGVVNLSYAVLGIASLLSSTGFQVATALGYSIWILGDGLGHLRRILAGLEPDPNLQSMAYTDIIIPLVIVVILMVVYQNKKSKR